MYIRRSPLVALSYVNYDIDIGSIPLWVMGKGLNVYTMTAELFWAKMLVRKMHLIAELYRLVIFFGAWFN